MRSPAISVFSFLAVVLAMGIPSSVAIGQGSVRISGEVRGVLPGGAPVVVRCFRLHVNRSGRPRRLSKHEFYHASPHAELLAESGRFACADLRPGYYSIVAFQDLDRDGDLDYQPCEPLGWYCAQPAGFVEAIDARAGSVEANVSLRRTTPFPIAESPRKQSGPGGGFGELLRVEGIPTLRLRGTARQRGHAHGSLIGRQILDFFEFYILEDKFKSARLYQSTFVPFLEKNFRYPPEFLVEIDAVVAGMKESGIDMHIASLGRDFYRTDLLAINAYIESRAMRSSCTQFAFWGKQTEGTDAAGGTIAGRNMDGEIDLRKTTVSHFLVFAIDQRDESKKRYLNLMWPGFVGTITGINEDGLYSMENAGGTGPGPVVDGLVPISWTQRFILEHAPGTAGPEAVTRLIDANRSSGGGSCGPGCIILFATPFVGQKAPAFVYEGDRFGGAMRLPGEVRPAAPTQIMAANHHLKYGADADRPGTYFGKSGSFSSRWRYEAGMHLVESWTRRDRKIGTAEMIRLLQTAAHGTTEHSIIFRPNQKILSIAVDDLAADMWDAPYREFKTIGFEQFFPKYRTWPGVTAEDEAKERVRKGRRK